MKSYYVYALKDPRLNPAAPFYIGKGTGNRANDHLLNVDDSRKGARIKEIRNSGIEPLVTILCDGLSEMNALKLEAELISAFGTMDTGGLLTNNVIPSGLRKTIRNSIVVPTGSIEKAQLGLGMLKEAVIELAKSNPNGITNSDAVKAFGLQSDYLGGSKDYLVWSILGLLMKEGKMVREEGTKRHRAIILGKKV